ncbi:MAG: DUF5719 family protein, partial [Microbacterium sp.]
VLVCSGSFRALGRDATAADRMVSAGTPGITLAGSDGDPASEALDMPQLDGGSGARRLTGAVQDRTVPLIAAAESVALNADDLRGLAASPCRQPAMQTWLVGGSVVTGASDVIVLSNPADVPATVSLTVFGARRSASTVVVPPKTQQALPLASIAPDELTPVVQVVSEGAAIRAVLQSSLMRVLEPSGVDVQDGLAAPQRSLVFTGVQVPTAADAPTLRLLSPQHDVSAQVRVRVDGSAPQEFSVALERGVPTEVALADLAPGFADVEVHADEPVVAAVKQSTNAGNAADFSWMTPAPEIADAIMFAVPQGPAAQLHLANDADQSVGVVLRTGTGEQHITVPAASSVAVSVSVGSAELDPDGAVRASVTMGGDGQSAQLAGWPLWPVPQTQHPITVYP